jgi:hypothetical protein
LAYIVIIAGGTLALEAAGIHPADWKFAVIMLVVNIVLLGIIFGVIDRGRLISPAYSRLDKRDMERLRRVRYERARYTTAPSEGGAD